jgi:hypothetical protein
VLAPGGIKKIQNNLWVKSGSWRSGRCWLEVYARRGDERSLAITSWSGPHTSLVAGSKLRGMPHDFRDVDPRELRLPSRRGDAAYRLSTV